MGSWREFDNSLASPSDVHNARFDAAHTDAEIGDLLAHRKRSRASTLSNRIR
jgi:hypothetical protein